MDFSFTYSIHGNLMLNVGAFEYCKDKVGGKLCYWRCVNSTKQKGHCKATARTQYEDGEHSQVHLKHKQHNHLPDNTNQALRDFTAELKDNAAKNPHDIPSLILTKTLRNCPDELLNKLPNKKALIQQIKRIQKPYRREQVIEPCDARFDVDLDLMTFKDESFLISDKVISKSDGKQDRIIGFGSKMGLKLLFDTSVISFDGTFNSAPKGWLQLITISAMVGNTQQYLPVVHFLLTGRSYAIICALFAELKKIAKEMKKKFSPKYAVMDLDVTQAKGCKDELVDIEILWCFFHHQQIVQKHLKKERLIPLVTRSSKFCNFMRSFRALPQLPAEYIRPAFLLLKEAVFLWVEENLVPEIEDEASSSESSDDEFQETFCDVADLQIEPEINDPNDQIEVQVTQSQKMGIIKYFAWFEKGYVGNNEKEPTYKPEQYSVFERHSKKIPTTTNISESFHCRLFNLLRNKKPGFYKLTKTLMDVAKLNDLTLHEILQGRECEVNKEAERRYQTIRAVMERADMFDSLMELLEEIGAALKKKKLLL